VTVCVIVVEPERGAAVRAAILLFEFDMVESVPEGWAGRKL
jgi:hypothetical protein